MLDMLESATKLKDKIDDSGMTIPTLAEKADMDKYVLYNRLKGLGEWKSTEISGLSRALRLTKRERDEIFL